MQSFRQQWKNIILKNKKDNERRGCVHPLLSLSREGHNRTEKSRKSAHYFMVNILQHGKITITKKRKEKGDIF